MITIVRLILAGAALGLTPSAQGSPLWSDFSVSVLRGTAYAVDYALDSNDSARNVITVEYTADYPWGDIFTFVDRLSSDHHQELYWELQPRFSLGYWREESPSADGVVEDLFVATTLEMANFDDPDSLSTSAGSFTNTLVGLGMSWRMPALRYFHSNVYRAFNEAEANDYQLTLAWGLPFDRGGQRFLYDGFIDWSSGANDHQPSFNWTSQLKHDLGSLWGYPHWIYWGAEYVFWHNKFGISDRTSSLRSTERNLNLLLKVHL